MNRTRALGAISVLLAGAVFFPTASLPADNPSTDAAATHRATFDQYCVGCHSGPRPFANVNLAAENFDTANFEKNGVIWEKLARKLRDRADAACRHAAARAADL